MRLTLLLMLIVSTTLAAQQPATYKARLGVTPVDANNQPLVAGAGSVTATLNGNTLRVAGTFGGLVSPATTAKVHVGPKGIRGPAVLELTVTPATSGTIDGTLALTAAQVDHLRRGRLYVQLNSLRAADGNLWGWLLPVTGAGDERK